MKWVPLKRLCVGAPQYGLNTSASAYSNTGIRFLRTTDIGPAGSVADDGAVYIDPALVGDAYKLVEGDLLFSRSGTLGRHLLYRQAMGQATFAGYLVRFRPSSEVSSEFLAYCAQARFFQEAIEADAVSSTISNFNAEKYSQLRVPSWLLRDQRAIVNFLDAETARIDALIAKKRRLVELATKRFENLILYAIAGHSTSADRWKDSGLAWLGPIPAHWALPWVGANFQTQLGKMLNASAASGPEQYPYLRNTNVQWDHLEMEDLATMTFTAEDRARCALQSGDLLVCEGGEVGRAAVWHGEGTNIYFQKAIHRVRSLGDGNTRFLMYCLWAAASRKVFEVEGNQSTIVHLTGEKLREHRFPLPPRAEQDRIVRQLDSAQQLTREVHAKLTRQIDLLAERRQALITAAVTGELDVAQSIGEEAS